MEHNSISMNYTRIWGKRSKVLKMNMILLNSMYAEVTARSALEPKHKHALQKVAYNIGSVSGIVDFSFAWLLLVCFIHLLMNFNEF